MRSFVVVVVSALSGLSACAGIDLSSAEQHIDPPQQIFVTSVSDRQVSLSWTAVPGAFKYFAFQKSPADADFVFAGTTLAPGTSQVATGLTPNTTYQFAVVTVSTDGSVSVRSAPVSVTTLRDAPGAPRDVAIQFFTDVALRVIWTNFPTATKVSVFESVNGGPNQFKASVVAPDSALTVAGLTPGTLYCYQMQSTLPDGSVSGLSRPACATTLGAPETPGVILATAISDTRILVQWMRPLEGFNFDVFRSTSGGPFVLRGSATVPTEFLDIDLQPETQYCYQVTNVFESGAESPPTGQACATTLAAGGGGDLQGYWRIDEGVFGSQALDSSGFGRHGTLDDAGHELQDLPNVDDDRSSIAFSLFQNSAITVLPAPAFDLPVTGEFATTVAFWTKLPAAGTFRFIGSRERFCGRSNWEIGQDADGLYISIGDLTRHVGVSIPVGTWTHVAWVQVPGANPNQHIYLDGIEVVATSFAGGTGTGDSLPLTIGHVGDCSGSPMLMDDIQFRSRAMSAAEIAQLGQLPPPPTHLVVTSSTSVSVDLAWDPVPGATAYIVSKGAAPGTERFFTHSPASPATYQGDHLAPNTSSSWTVRTVAHGLFSNPSNEATGTTAPPPSAPANATATVIAPDRIQVQWSPVKAAAKYLVFESVDGGSFTFAGSMASPVTTFTAVRLDPATTYSFEIQAEDAVQTQGPLSAPVSATTP